MRRRRISLALMDDKLCVRVCIKACLGWVTHYNLIAAQMELFPFV